MAKIHKYVGTADYKPESGGTIRAVCGEEVVSAVCFVPVELSAPPETILLCRRCFFKYYECWIVTGEESKQLEAELG
jgi:hypothetical protein